MPHETSVVIIIHLSPNLIQFLSIKVYNQKGSLCLYLGCRVEVLPPNQSLTHWGRVTHICVDNLTIIGSDNGLSPGRRQAIIWTNAGILLIGPLGTNFSEIWIEIQIFSFRIMYLKMSSAKWRPFCLGLNVLIQNVRFCCVLLQFDHRWISFVRTLRVQSMAWVGWGLGTYGGAQSYNGKS